MVYLTWKQNTLKKNKKITSLSLINLPPNSPFGLRNWTTNYHIKYVT